MAWCHNKLAFDGSANDLMSSHLTSDVMMVYHEPADDMLLWKSY